MTSNESGGLIVAGVLVGVLIAGLFNMGAMVWGSEVKSGEVFRHNLATYKCVMTNKLIEGGSSR